LTGLSAVARLAGVAAVAAVGEVVVVVGRAVVVVGKAVVANGTDLDFGDVVVLAVLREHWTISHEVSGISAVEASRKLVRWTGRVAMSSRVNR